jgi:hypothetical protein
MSTVSRPTNRGLGFAAGFVTAVFLWTLALSVSPQLHSRIHPDANTVEHTCAVTFIASGNFDHAAPPPIIGTPDAVVSFSQVSVRDPFWIPSTFLSASIFEHAPPAQA